MRIDHAVIRVADLERAVAFYERVLDVTVEGLEFGRVAFVLGDARLHVHHPDARPHPKAVAPGGPGSTDLCFEWPDTAAAAIDHLRACDVAVIEGPVSRTGARGAGQSVYFHDPDGNLLELISYSG